MERERRREQRLRENLVRGRQIAQLEATARRFMGTTEKMSKRAKGMQSRADKMKERLVEVEDLAAAHYLDRVGRERGIGTLVELGGRRE